MGLRQTEALVALTGDIPDSAISGLEMRLRGHWILLARTAWIAVGLLALGVSLAGIAPEFTRLQLVCTAGGDACEGYLTPDILRFLQAMGHSAASFAAYQLGIQLVLAPIPLITAGVIVAGRPDDPVALLVALWIWTFGLLFNERPDLLAATHPGWWLPVQVVKVVAGLSLFLACYLFPDGRFVPRWTRWIVAVVGVEIGASFFFPGSSLAPGRWMPSWLGLPVFLALLGSFVFAQVYRYRRVSNPAQRQQTKWVIFGVVCTLAAFMAYVLVPHLLFPSLYQPGRAGVIWALASPPIFGAILALMPLSIGLAVLRSRLWSIDILINRTLVYGGLTASVVALYVLVVGVLGALLQARGNLAISLLGAGLVAVLFQPIRERLQRSVNRLMYGERDDPYAVISRLDQRLEASLAPDAVLPAIVHTVREALKVPYAAITLATGGERSNTDAAGFAIVAEVGSRVDTLLRLPLVYQNETVGELVLAPRAVGEAFAPADRRLLQDLARHAGLAAHAVRLNEALQRSRERLVNLREEERRRLRRDLHDGLGPALASQTLKASTARYLVEHDPAAAVHLLTSLEADVKSVLQEVRRLVYDLRPPALDDLGLAGALRTLVAEQIGPQASLTCAVEVVADDLPTLPAAVEVAVYRIVQAAVTNVLRHAHATRCEVRLAVEARAPAMSADTPDAHDLVVEVRDDGAGLAPERRTGVGLVSMRERAAEIGGQCSVETRPDGGTRVLARLPLP